MDYRLYFVLNIPLFIAGWIFLSRRKKVLLTVVNNYQLKRLEEAVFTVDMDAFFITGSTFNVIGKGFSRRKLY